MYTHLLTTSQGHAQSMASRAEESADWTGQAAVQSQVHNCLSERD